MMDSEQIRDFCKFGTIYTVKNIRILCKKGKQIHHTKNLEHLHKTRVSTRKLRAALDNFKDCYPAQEHDLWLKELKSLTKVLGKSRDLDVQIDFLKKFLSETTHAQYQVGIKRLILRLSQRRAKQQPRIQKSLSGLYRGKFFTHFEKMSIEEGRSDFAKTPPVYSKILEIVKLRINETLKYSNDIYNPEKILELHEMRKKNKQLRYTLELFKPLFGTKLDYSIAKVTELHDLLGNIHDNDVWIGFIPEFSEAELKRTKEFFGDTVQFRMVKPGLKYLSRNRKKEREKDYISFLTLWNSLQAEDFWGKLPKIIEGEIIKSSTKEKILH